VHGALGFEDWPSYEKLLMGVGITTVAWVSVTLLSRPSSHETLVNFVKLINPGGPGWKPFAADVPTESRTAWKLPYQILAMLLGSFMVYALLFSTGNFLYGDSLTGILLGLAALLSGLAISRIWKRL
jgi:hypothetical protein